MRKKILATILTLCMLFSMSMVVTAQAADFEDTRGHWAENQIKRWSDFGVVQGTGDGFKPNDGMTRAAAAQVFTNLLGLKDTGDIARFTDVKGDAWYADAISKAVAAGILTGTNDNKMLPDESVDRQQFFVMFARAVGLNPQTTTSGPAATGAADWALGYINAMTDRGYVKGGDRGVDPTGSIDRASVMALMDQTIGAYTKTANATLTANPQGITLVAAQNVTVTGTAGDVMIAAGAAGSVTNIRDLTVSGTLTLNTISGLDISGNSKIANVVLTERAANQNVNIAGNSTVDNLVSNAVGATIAGAGKLTKAEINANNDKVNTNGTVVAVAPNVTGTTGKNIAISAGQSYTTTGTIASGGGGGGGGGGRRSTGSDTTTYTGEGFYVTDLGDDGYALTVTTAGATVNSAKLAEAVNGANAKYTGGTSFTSVAIAASVGDGSVTLDGIETDDLDILGGGSNSVNWLGGAIRKLINFFSGFGTRLAMNNVETSLGTKVAIKETAVAPKLDDVGETPSVIGEVTVEAKTDGTAQTVAINAAVQTVNIEGETTIEVGDKTDVMQVSTSSSITIATYEGKASEGDASIGTITTSADVAETVKIALSDVEVEIETVEANAGETVISTSGTKTAVINTVEASNPVVANADVVQAVTVMNNAAEITVTGSEGSTVILEVTDKVTEMPAVKVTANTSVTAEDDETVNKISTVIAVVTYNETTGESVPDTTVDTSTKVAKTPIREQILKAAKNARKEAVNAIIGVSVKLDNTPSTADNQVMAINYKAIVPAGLNDTQKTSVIVAAAREMGAVEGVTYRVVGTNNEKTAADLLNLTVSQSDLDSLVGYNGHFEIEVLESGVRVALFTVDRVQ